jgi:sporulation integral membrane protein YlbJ
MSTFCFVLILRNSDAAIEYMGRGLTLCARTVIPSLFPFMVISELLVSSGAGEAFGRLFAWLMRRVFGLSGAGASAVFLGSMCGFPVGAKTAVGLLDRNVISRAECEHLLTFTSNPSSAFLITAVGVSLYGNRRLGVVLYITVLGSGLLVGFLARFFLHRTETAEHPHFPSGLHVGGAETFTGAVSGAATGMLTVCAYVIFFSALTGALGCAVKDVGGAGETGYTLLSGFLEMTGGISLASSLGDHRLGLILTAAFAGWSGISVHCQIMTLCGGRGLSFKPYFLAKAVQGLLCGGIMGAILTLKPAWVNPAEGAVMDAILAVTSLQDISIPALLTDGVFAVGWILSRVDGWRRAESSQ